MQLKPTLIPGCFEIETDVRCDERGRFVKTVHRGDFGRLGLEHDFAEQYYTVSEAGVVRGLHFQAPPNDHAKLVYCIAGEVLDVVLDLRAGSPTWRQSYQLHLSAERGNMLYIPRGLAHGFCALERAVMVYNVTTAYAPQDDRGVLWNSAGIEWPIANPMLSDRDRSFPPLKNFESPFLYPQEVCS